MKICPTCKIEKSRAEFSKHCKEPDGLQTRCKQCEKSARKYVETSCLDCGKVKKRRKYQLTKWQGRCRDCAQKLELSRPERLLKLSISAREQVLRQGGIPNAKHFTSDRVKGSVNHNWKGGIGSGRIKERSSSAAKQWSSMVLRRDNYTCQLCNQRGGKLHAHHKKEWQNYPEFRYDLDNGVTLCEPCHKNKAHRGSWRNIPTDWEILKENYAQ